MRDGRDSHRLIGVFRLDNQLDNLTQILIGVLIGINFLQVGYFYAVRGKADVKRAIAIAVTIATWLVFATLVWHVEAVKNKLGASEFFWLLALLSPFFLLNLCSIRFCSDCGKPWYRHQLFWTRKNCWWCGHRLKK
ncbi:hypothetical protein Pan258_08830 [Symmachiella dynata]|nr:hypothetical protein Pan258_08830 [Symmachiella dynata]